MRKALIIAMLLSMLPLFASAQQAQHVHPTVKIVDGKVNPELIPDATIYRLYLLSLTTPVNPTVEQANRQSVHFTKLGLAGIDQIQLVGVLRNYRDAYDSLVARYNVQATAAQARGEFLSDALLRQQLDDLVVSTRAQLKSSVSGVANDSIDATVQKEKTLIRIFKSEAQ